MVSPDSGYVGAHPCVQIAHNAGQLLLRYAAEFGLTPSAERRLGSITRLTTTSTARSTAVSALKRTSDEAVTPAQ